MEDKEDFLNKVNQCFENSKIKDGVEQVKRLINKESFESDLGEQDNSSAWATYTPEGSHLYIHEVLPYGFTMVSIYKKGETEWVYTLRYDLRNKVHEIYKNGKPLKFRENNIVNMFSGHGGSIVLHEIDRISYKKGYDPTAVYDEAYNHYNGMYSNLLKKLGKIGREQVPIIHRFLERLMTSNRVELIYKSGLPWNFTMNIVETLVNPGYKNSTYALMNLEETKPHKFLGLSKGVFKLAKEGIFSYIAYRNISHVLINSRNSYSHSGSENTNSDKLMDYLYSVGTQAKELDDKYGMSIAWAVVDIESGRVPSFYFGGDKPYLNIVDDLDYSASALHISKIIGAPVSKIIEYLFYKLEVEQGAGAANSFGIASIYTDYLGMVRRMHVDYPTFPKFLKTRHDILAKNYKVVKDQEKNERIQAQYDAIQPWEDTKGLSSTFTIVAPKTANDIVDEANQQHNCVASYIDRVANGNTHILFLRERTNPEKSLVTVQVTKESWGELVIKQAYQAFNMPITEDQKEFLDKWVKRINKKEEMKMGA